MKESVHATLMGFHIEKRCLIMSIEDEQRLGNPTVFLDAQLLRNREETREFLDTLSPPLGFERHPRD